MRFLFVALGLLSATLAKDPFIKEVGDELAEPVINSAWGVGKLLEKLGADLDLHVGERERLNEAQTFCNAQKKIKGDSKHQEEVNKLQELIDKANKKLDKFYTKHDDDFKEKETDENSQLEFLEDCVRHQG